MTTLTLSPLGVAACATAHEPAPVVEAVLHNTQDSASREAIRIFVREKSGANVISNPDSLGQTPLLTNHKRHTSFGSGNTRESFLPLGEYRLILDENKRCWLVHRVKDEVSRRELPPSAICAPYRAN